MPVRTSSLSITKKTGKKGQKMKALTLYPIAVAIATSGCHKETPKESIITSKYEFKCETVKSNFTINIIRCENNEAICYVKTNALSCFRKRFK